MVKTMHAAGCGRAFGRLDPACPRCAELANGAPPRKGWGKRADRSIMAALKAHSCTAAQCGPVCTYGDW